MTLAKIAFSVIGIYTCFLTWGILQERVSTTSYGDKETRFKYFFFLNTIQAFTASIVAIIYIKFSGENLGKVNSIILFKFLQVSFLGVIGSPIGYESLKHIDYPTFVLGKSCKLVPVMFMNIILYKKKFPIYKYIVVTLITIGITIFTLLQKTSEKKKSSEPSSFYGIILLTINLLIDGITNSTQDQMFNKYKITGKQLMFYMNLFSGILMSFWLLNPFNNELFNALTFCKNYPNIIIDILLFCLCGSLGQCFIFFTLHNFGSLFLVTITVTRKFFTVLLSVFLFNHILNIGQWFAVGLVFLGIGIEIYVKQSESRKLQEKFDRSMPEENLELEKSIDEKSEKKQRKGVISNIKEDKKTL